MKRTWNFVAALFAALLLCSQVGAAGSLKVHFLDVGQGDAILIQSPSGQNVLYDGGEPVELVSSYLKALQVGTLDLVIASHNHVDHLGGIPSVLRDFRPRFIMDNGVPATSGAYRDTMRVASEVGTQLLEPTARQIALGDVALQVIPPPHVSSEQNVNSVGLILSYGRFRLSMAGDAEGPEWDWWMRHFRDLLRPVMVHKSSHHGSRNGDVLAALQLLRPAVVVVSCGRNNGYGHPSSQALQMYATAGAQVRRTDTEGPLLLTAEESGDFEINTETIVGMSDRRSRASDRIGPVPGLR